MPSYDFKFTPEAVWFVLTAMAAAGLQMVNGAMPTDWHTWAGAVGVGMVRAGIGAFLHMMGQDGLRV